MKRCGGASTLFQSDYTSGIYGPRCCKYLASNAMWNAKYLQAHNFNTCNPIGYYTVFSLCLLPLQGNLFEWHFTIVGPEETDFEGGYYHGRLIFPSRYPIEPWSISMLTVSHFSILCKKAIWLSVAVLF